MLNKLLNHFVQITRAAIRIYTPECILTDYFGGHDAADTLLQEDGILRKIKETASEKIPGLYTPYAQIYYGTVLCQDFFLVAGPVSFDYSVVPEADEKRAVYCECMQFCEELLLLHNILNDKAVSFYELTEKNFGKPELQQDVKKELSRVYFRYQEKGTIHNPYDQEVRELNSIREGNIEKLKECMDEVVDGEYATLSKTPLRSAINLAIVTLALTARAAIDGGMLPEESFSLNDSYILQVDSAVNVGQIYELVRRAKIEYATIVHQHKELRQTHALIEKTKNLVYKNMHNKIVIRELAHTLQVTPEYLSVLFRREEGMTLNDFIMKTKINLTENLLRYSNYSIEEISYYFGFCSQSHYGKVFKKWKKMTPKQFRDRFGDRQFISEFEKMNESSESM